MKILLAVDGSETTRRMLAYFAAHDELLGAGHRYAALTVVPPIVPHAAAFMSRAAIDRWYDEQADGVLNPVRAFAAQNGWPLEALQAVGRAADEIALAARDGGYDLLVMGTHGQTALMNLVLGSVATRVLALTELPVLLVP